ncbi:hypothetical protein AAF712_016410 [Marasmius tenuissimus]|uniref:Uncharacterized protein n=1 Tax=Marasmius tenuissimus TaxID=585030 RepID=A0ABR2Z5S9_9AGAR
MSRQSVSNQGGRTAKGPSPTTGERPISPCPLPRPPTIRQLIAAKDRDIAAAITEAKQLTEDLKRMREANEEQSARDKLEHATEIDEMERRHFFGVGRRVYEWERVRATELQSRRESHAAHILKLQEEIKMYQRCTSQVQGQLQRAMGHRVTRNDFDNATQRLEALFRDQQIAIIDEIRARLRERDPRSQVDDTPVLQNDIVHLD